MAQQSQPPRDFLGAEIAVLADRQLTGLLSEWLRCAHWACESTAHRLGDAAQAARAQRAAVEALENRFPGEWVTLRGPLEKWQQSLAHNPGQWRAACTRCNHINAAEAALHLAASGSEGLSA